MWEASPRAGNMGRTERRLYGLVFVGTAVLLGTVNAATTSNPDVVLALVAGSFFCLGVRYLTARDPMNKAFWRDWHRQSVISRVSAVGQVVLVVAALVALLLTLAR